MSEDYFIGTCELDFADCAKFHQVSQTSADSDWFETWPRDLTQFNPRRLRPHALETFTVAMLAAIVCLTQR